MTGNRPFALGGGAPREVEIIKRAYSQGGQYYNKNKHHHHQFLAFNFHDVMQKEAI